MDSNASDIFVSYAREDRGRIAPLVAALKARGWRVFWDPVILPGQSFEDVIQVKLEQTRCVIVLWSEYSIHKDWVRVEANEGRKRKILVPALLDRVEPPLAFRMIQAADLVGWQGHAPDDALAPLMLAVEEMLQEVGLVQTLRDKGGMRYVWIPPGQFTMGATENESGAPDRERPAHRVTITQGFWMSEAPVTVRAWREFASVPDGNGEDEMPVVNVTWKQTSEYCAWTGMRLPTEAEWEYAARAGSSAPRYGELDKIAWYRGNSGRKLHPVKGKQPNDWKLYDMLGNVWEWVGDWYGLYSPDDAVDPVGPAESSGSRVLRGGAFFYYAEAMRVAFRVKGLPEGRGNYVGFRCVRN